MKLDSVIKFINTDVNSFFMQRKLYNSCFILKTNLIINIAANLFISLVRNIHIIHVIRFCMQVYILIRKVLISKAIDVKVVVYKNICKKG